MTDNTLPANHRDLYDLVGAGFGPANLALVLAIDDANEGSNENAAEFLLEPR